MYRGGDRRPGVWPRADLRAHVVQVPPRGLFVLRYCCPGTWHFGPIPEADESTPCGPPWRRPELAEEDVRALPQGLEDRAGRAGPTTSAAASVSACAWPRALLYWNPAVLVLDDPLSAVDTGTETHILANLARLRAGRTTLVVSHRPGQRGFCRRASTCCGTRDAWWSRETIVRAAWLSHGTVPRPVRRAGHSGRAGGKLTVAPTRRLSATWRGDQLGKPYDFRLLKRLASYGRPHLCA